MADSVAIPAAQFILILAVTTTLVACRQIDGEPQPLSSSNNQPDQSCNMSGAYHTATYIYANDDLVARITENGSLRCIQYVVDNELEYTPIRVSQE